MNIGENIKRLREQKGLSQSDIADQLGFNRSWLAQIERGAKNINILTAIDVAEILGVDVYELAGRKNPKG